MQLVGTCLVRRQQLVVVQHDWRGIASASNHVGCSPRPNWLEVGRDLWGHSPAPDENSSASCTTARKKAALRYFPPLVQRRPSLVPYYVPDPHNWLENLRQHMRDELQVAGAR